MRHARLDTTLALLLLQGKIDPGQKKVPKVYHLAVHPTRCVGRFLVCCGLAHFCIPEASCRKNGTLNLANIPIKLKCAPVCHPLTQTHTTHSHTRNYFTLCRPHLVAAATNTGAVLLSFDTNERPPVVALPAQVSWCFAASGLPTRHVNPTEGLLCSITT